MVKESEAPVLPIPDDIDPAVFEGYLAEEKGRLGSYMESEQLEADHPDVRLFARQLRDHSLNLLRQSRSRTESD